MTKAFHTADCITIASEEDIAAHVNAIPEDIAKKELAIATAILDYVIDMFPPAETCLRSSLRVKCTTKVDYCSDLGIYAVIGISYDMHVIDVAEPEHHVADVFAFSRRAPFLKTETHARLLGALRVLHKVFSNSMLTFKPEEHGTSVVTKKSSLHCMRTSDMQLSFKHLSTIEEVISAFMLACYDMDVDFSSLS